MQMDPQWIIAACTAAGLLITWTTTIASAAIWFAGRLEKIKREILVELQTKHDENKEEVAALRTLVMRHDIILEPEFNGSGQRAKR